MRFLRNKKSAIIGLYILIIVSVPGLYLFPLPEKINPSWSKVVRFRDHSVMRIYLSDDEQWRIFLPLSQIDKRFIQTTLLYEDRIFWFHPGFNILSMLRALYQNIRAGRVISGGSTITMQLARICEPRPRNIFSKFLELLRALQFEMRLGKKRILELYLNLAPYGGNVEGVGAAMLAYFSRLPENMTPEEIAFLVALPKSPTLRRPAGKVSTVQGRNQVLRVMFHNHCLSRAEYNRAINAAVPRTRRRFPFLAPHIADFLISKYPELNDIKSTIDPAVQKKVENILYSYKKRIYDLGASNAAVIVIENGSRKVRAGVGSLDYFDFEHSGQVRGFSAYRSPGSALKPFLYIMAIEDGLINPLMLIEDAPYKFGRFKPKNYSGTWRGLVTAEKALSLSLNLPFVLILKRYGYQKFIHRLQKANLTGPLEYSEYGLPIITGGMEVNLLELTNLYATLARGGMHGMPIFRADKKELDEFSLFRAGAVWLTMDALSKRDRPDAPKLAAFTLPRKKVFWKTGTSFGRRDAWSIGFTPEYTVGVWTGNFSGEGADSIVGAIAAAPIMFDIIKSLQTGSDNFSWESRAKAELEPVSVCAFSGYRPGPNCLQRKTVYVLKDGHPYKACPFHKKFIIEKKTGCRANPYRKYKENEIEEKIFVIYPPQVQKIMSGQGKEPEFPPDFRLADQNATLKIISPLDGAVYFLPRGVRNADEISLQAYTSSADDRIYWFINDRYYGSTRSGEIMEFIPQNDELKIIAQDASSSKMIRIQIDRE